MKEEFNPIFITGAFRSGTTLLARALSVHKDITIASDAYFQFFKAFRNEVFHLDYTDFDDNSPVSDNFFSPFLEVNRKIRNSTFDMAIKSQNTEDIKKNIIKFCEVHAPKLIPPLKEITAKDYKTFLKKLLLTVKEAYNKSNSKYSGVKFTFAEQFVSTILNTYPTSKIIWIIRDPRAIYASIRSYKTSLKGRGIYPLLFVIRHWRKSIAYAIENINKTDNIMFLKYETLIEKPEEIMKNICTFLEVDYDPEMVNAEKYTDGEGKQWMQNSSYGKSKSISNKFINKWKEILTEKEIQVIEDLCEIEMNFLGYERITNQNILKSVFDPPATVPKAEVDEWFIKYLHEFENNEKEMNKELIRYLLAHADNKEDDVLERIFLIKNFLSKIQDSKLKEVIKNG